MHPNIINYIGSEIFEGKFLIYLENASEGSLVSAYKMLGPLKESIIRSYTKQILKGLEYLHLHDIVHHDLKGANVLLDSNGRIRLTDFGWALVVSNQMNITQKVSAIKGTIPWMAPEVIMQQGYSLKSDIWSLGCTVIEMAIAGNPWGKAIKGVFSDMFKIVNEDIRPDIPEYFSEEGKDFLNKWLQRDPDDRPMWHELLQHPFIKLPE